MAGKCLGQGRLLSLSRARDLSFLLYTLLYAPFEYIHMSSLYATQHLTSHVELVTLLRLDAVSFEKNIGVGI